MCGAPATHRDGKRAAGYLRPKAGLAFARTRRTEDVHEGRLRVWYARIVSVMANDVEAWPTSRASVNLVADMDSEGHTVATPSHPYSTNWLASWPPTICRADQSSADGPRRESMHRHHRHMEAYRSVTCSGGPVCTSAIRSLPPTPQACRRA